MNTKSTNDTKSILIPIALMEQILHLLEHIDFKLFDVPTIIQYFDVYDALVKKQKAIAVRQAYSDLRAAKDEKERNNALLQYWMKKG